MSGPSPESSPDEVDSFYFYLHRWPIRIVSLVVVSPLISAGIGYCTTWLFDWQLEYHEVSTGEVLTRGAHEQPGRLGVLAFFVALWVLSSLTFLASARARPDRPIETQALISGGMGCLYVIAVVLSIIFVLWLVLRQHS
jgi:hypothetical protein